MKITESIRLFIEELSKIRSAKTIGQHRYVLELFEDYLINYAGLSSKENKDGDYILMANIDELLDGQVADFLEWYLIRKVIGPKWLMSSAPVVMKAYIKWLDQKGLITEGPMDEFIKVTKIASKDLPRVDKAATLLYKLCDKNSDRFMDADFEDEDYKEDYGEVIRIIEDKLYLDYDGEEIGPIQITKEIAKYLKKGDTVNLVVGRKGKMWYPLELGNVYLG